MRGALIHGVLLAVMLVYGYRTWTRDKTVQPNVGNVVLWDKSEADVVSIEYRSPKKIVRLERKPEGYWWGSDTLIETRIKPKTSDSASGSGSAAEGSAAGSAGSAAEGSGAGSGSASPSEPPTVEEEETGRKVREFPIGEAGEKLVKSYVRARALRDLGKPSEAAKNDYKLGTKPTNVVTWKDGTEVSTTTITVTFKDGSRTFLVGGSVYGGSDKYVMDQQSGKAYVLSRDLLSSLEIGQTSLQLTDARGFDATKIASVTLDAGGKSKTWARITTQGADGKGQMKVWADPATKKADQTATNFIDNANNLRPTEYAPNLKVADMTQVMKLTYKDERGALLGTLTLYKYEKPAELPEGQELDPANPPKGEIEYYIVTEKTRVPALVRKDTAQRSEQDIDTVFSGKAPTPPVDTKDNPFGNMPPGHGSLPGSSGAPADPHGHGAADPHGHGAPAGAAPPAVKVKPAELKPAETKPAETKPAETETKPAAAAPAGSAKAPEPAPPMAPAPAQ